MKVLSLVLAVLGFVLVCASGWLAYKWRFRFTENTDEGTITLHDDGNPVLLLGSTLAGAAMLLAASVVSLYA